MSLRHLVYVLAVLMVPVSSAWAGDAIPRQWTVEKDTREALIFLPSVTSDKPSPALFVFHGHGGRANTIARRTAFNELWPEALVVYMQGLPTPGKFDPEGKRPGWQKSVGEQGDRDLKFFDAVLATLRSDYVIDEKRIYATGHSNGAGFTYLLWAARGDVFAAVAPSAGGASGKLSSLKPLAALHIAGEKDDRVPYAFQVRTMNAVRRLNGCSEEGVPWAASGTLAGTLYPSASGTPFVSVLHPGGHEFPREAPGLIVKFFQEHAKK